MTQAAACDLATHFHRDGYVAPIDLLAREEAADLRARIDDLMARHGGTPELAQWSYYKSHILFDWVAALAAHPRVLAAVEPLLGPDILLWESSFFVKQPHSPAHFGWHQDLTYWYLEPKGVALTVWVALSEVTVEHGCMQILPGTHGLGQLPHEPHDDPASLLARGQFITADLPEETAADITLEAGQGSIHSSLVVHGSRGNRAATPRVCCLLNFVPARAQPTRFRYSALPVLGEDRHGHFTADPWPDGSLSAANLAAYEDSLDMFEQRYGT